MSNDDSTRWRLTGIEGFSSSLDLVIAVDTGAEAVTSAIEEAAEAHGIALVRVEDDDAPAEVEAEEATPPPIAPGSVSNLVITGQSDTRHQ